MKNENPPFYFWLMMAFTFGLFFYLAGCAFAGVQPFSHKKVEVKPNISCPNELQIFGYCCKSQEQYDSGDCTK